MAPSNVIQGFFPHGLPQFAEARSGVVQQQAARPGWAMQAIAQPGAHRGQSQAAQPRMASAPPHAAPSPVRAQQAAAVRVPAHLHGGAVGRGEQIPVAVRQKMEAVFGTSFADVRVHVGNAARAIGALAYTQGSDIHFAPGQYDPSSVAGQRLLGHELAHVVQQRAGRVRNPFGSGTAIVHDQQMEAEAERMATRAAVSRAPVQAKPAAAIQRVTYRWDKNTETWAVGDDVTGGMVAGPPPGRKGAYKDEYVWVDDVPALAPASSSSSSSSSSPSAPALSGVGFEWIQAEYEKFRKKKKAPSSGIITTTAGHVSGSSLSGTSRTYVQSGNSATVTTHAEQQALDVELTKVTGDVHLIQNAWPCDKCLAHFKTRADLAARKVVITVTEDNGTYSKDNGFSVRHTIGQIIIDKRVISYKNVVTLA